MANIHLTDVTLHVDELLGKAARANLEKDLRSLEGVSSVRSSKTARHLVTVTYDSRQVRSEDILKVISGDRLHAELIG